MGEREDKNGFALLLGLAEDDAEARPRPRSRAREDAGESKDRASAARAVRKALAVDGTDEDLAEALEAYLAVRRRD